MIPILIGPSGMTYPREPRDPRCSSKMGAIEAADFSGARTKLEYYLDGPAKGRLQRIEMPNGTDLEYKYDSAKRLAEVNCAGVYRLNYEYDSKGRLARVSQIQASGN